MERENQKRGFFLKRNPNPKNPKVSCRRPDIVPFLYITTKPSINTNAINPFTTHPHLPSRDCVVIANKGDRQSGFKDLECGSFE
jgi:hypothetical protein